MSKLSEVTDTDFEQTVLQSKVPVLVDFWATWCRPCIMVTPVLEELSAEYGDKISIYKVDVDKSVKTASKYGVMSIPNLIIFKDGQPASQVVGYKGKADLKKLIDAALG